MNHYLHTRRRFVQSAADRSNRIHLPDGSHHDLLDAGIHRAIAVRFIAAARAEDDGHIGIIQNAKPETLLGFQQPAYPALFVFFEFQKQFSFMAPVGDVPYIAVQVMSIRTSHQINKVIAWE